MENYLNYSLIYKLFTSTITTQLANYGKQHQILQNSQEGFREERWTSRKLQTLIAALEDSKLTHQDIYLLYIDFKNAFGLGLSYMIAEGENLSYKNVTDGWTVGQVH